MREYIVKIAEFSLTVFERNDEYTVYLESMKLKEGRDYIFHDDQMYLNLTLLRADHKPGIFKKIWEFINLKRFTP